ncbi:MAG: hydrogenase 2 operon protein HybA [Acidobacteria bacterium]|nr:MAG: hydrogenase 2 operon protein HybA [Acidobacteriota bacterium]
MSVDRRTALRLIAAGGAAATTTGAVRGDEAPAPPPDAVGLLYDTTKCIGCKTCVVACHEANELPPETREWGDGLYDAPTKLGSRTKNIIKLYRDDQGRESYMKEQCMHCVDPSCAGACMIGALQKREFGIVTWVKDRCIACRYCQVACPFNIPKFEWDARDPRIVKCELCRHLLARGEKPACVRVCPREAVIFGKRDELLAEAKRRIDSEPGRYVPKVYGETDGGGTQVLYVSHIAFEKLGLPDLGDQAPSVRARAVQHGLYQGFVAPAALYVVLGAVVLRNRKRIGNTDEEDDA